MDSLKQIIEQEVKKALQEARSTPGNPNVFWLVTGVGPRVPEKMQDLADGVLEGVSGISDNNKILMHWLGMGRNAVLVMNAKHVMQDNNGVTKVWYTDPHQLTEDNMALLRRIFNADEPPRGNRRILDNIWRKMYQNLLTESDEMLSRLGSMMRDGYIPTYDVFDKYENGSLTIDSPRDLAAYLKTEVDTVLEGGRFDELTEIPEAQWEHMVKRAIKDSVKTYSTEGEWVVDDSTLKVPAGSKLLVAVHDPLNTFPEEAQKKLKQGQEPKLGIDIPSEIFTMNMRSSIQTIRSVYEYGLDKRYDLRFIDLNQFKKIQLKMQVRHTYG